MREHATRAILGLAALWCLVGAIAPESGAGFQPLRAPRAFEVHIACGDRAIPVARTRYGWRIDTLREPSRGVASNHGDALRRWVAEVDRRRDDGCHGRITFESDRR